MLRTNQFQPIAALTVALIWIASPQPAAAEEITPQDLAPVDTGAFIHIEDFARYKQEMEDDPLLQFVRKRLQTAQLDELQILLDKLELEPEEMLDRYFGKNVVIFGPDFETHLLIPVKEGEAVDDDDPNIVTVGEGDDARKMRRINQRDMGRRRRDQMTPEQRQEFWRSVSEAERQQPRTMIFTEVAKEDIAHAVSKLEWKMIEEVGGFKTYKDTEEKGLIAVNDQWIGVASPENEEYFKRVLTNIGNGKTLTANEGFQDWVAQLPPKRMATMYYQPEGMEMAHVAGLVRANRSLTVHYVGYSTDLDEFIENLGDAEKIDFGPLPKQSVAAYAVNLNIKDALPPPVRNQLVFLNQFFAPKNVEEDILPNLGSPAIFFMGEIPQEQLDPDPGFPVPVFGVAVKLKNNEVAEDLDRAGQSIMVFANLAAAGAGAEALEVKKVNHAGTQLNTINLGPLLAKQQNDDRWLHAVDLAYGRIGDWYMVCSHSMFFKHGILSRPGDFGVRRKRDLDDLKPMLRIYVAPDGLSRMLEHWSNNDRFRSMMKMDAASKDLFAELSEVAKGYEYLDMTLNRREDDIVIGRVDLIRKREE